MAVERAHGRLHVEGALESVLPLCASRRGGSPVTAQARHFGTLDTASGHIETPGPSRLE